jgi:ribosomal protein L16/L10AE
MSPTLFREDGYRFYFFSREESRMHVHVACADGEAKFWIEPRIEAAQNVGMNDRRLRAAQQLVERHVDEIRRAWREHFGA